MKIGDKLLKVLNKKYPASETSAIRFGNYDLSIKADENGDAILMFIGKSGPNGLIRGSRFSRILIRDQAGKIIKDHWDNKGKT